MPSRKKRGRKSTSLIQVFFTVLVLAAVLFFAYIALGDPSKLFGSSQATAPAGSPTPAASPMSEAEGAGILELYVLDVGQGDSLFLRSPSGKTMLIDAGESKNFNTINAFLQEQGVEKLDLVIATHPHADHIGAMAEIIRKYEIGLFCMPEYAHTTKTFENMLDALLDTDTPVFYAWADAESYLAWDEAVSVRLLSPIKAEANAYRDINDYSVIVRICYGTDTMLLTGDAEAAAEALMLAHYSNAELQAEVLKFGHHGSSTSSSTAFLEAVAPETVLISCGENNSYGHPHAVSLDKIAQYGYVAYRTDLMGTIKISFSGHGYRVSTEKG